MYDSTSGAGSTHTIFLDREHRYNSVAIASVTSAGSGYGNGTGALKKTCITLSLVSTPMVRLRLESQLMPLVR